MEIICGVDEAGRGPLAGPVYAAAVILDPNKPIAGLTDSKLLTAKKRDALFTVIQEDALAFAIASAAVEEIDRLNILQASLLAMQRAVAALSIQPTKALIDGNKCPALSCFTQAIVQGDLTQPAISAASILAKVSRDRAMITLDAQHPEYGFAIHKGYPTRAHLQALSQFGPTIHHRHSFGPVKRLLLVMPA